MKARGQFTTPVIATLVAIINTKVGRVGVDEDDIIRYKQGRCYQSKIETLQLSHPTRATPFRRQ